MSIAARVWRIGRGAFRRAQLAFAICLFGVVLTAAAVDPPTGDEESPRVQALLEQAWAAESGRGLRRNPVLAAELYRQAGALGSAEGYYRLALIHSPGGGRALGDARATCYLAAASQLGHERAAALLERAAEGNPQAAKCEGDEGFPVLLPPFDLEGYLDGLPLHRRRIAERIRHLAPLYAVDVHLALAVAAVESNFNPAAVSPKLAMGVMQLIPATAERFGVRKPFDAEQNIRGGLAYLRWLGKYYQGDIVRVIAAYNAGEKAVDSFSGIPPYAETMAYVARVLSFSGRNSGSFAVHFSGKAGRGKMLPGQRRQQRPRRKGREQSKFLSGPGGRFNGCGDSD